MENLFIPYELMIELQEIGFEIDNYLGTYADNSSEKKILPMA
jgi:hypothetical protein